MMPQPNLGMPATTGPPPAVVYVPMAAQPKVYDKYSSKQSIGTGIAQIIIGGLCIAFNIVDLAVALYYSLGFIGHGFWCGVMIVAYMVLCIISASFTIGIVTVGILGAVVAGQRYNYMYSDCNRYGYRGYSYSYPYYCYSNTYQTGIAMESLLAILGLADAIIAIYAAAMCCKSGVCCSGTPTPIPVGYMANNGQMICINQTQVGQHVYLPQTAMGYQPGSVAPPPAFVPTYMQPGSPVPPPNYEVPNIKSAETEAAPVYTALQPPPDRKF